MRREQCQGHCPLCADDAGSTLGGTVAHSATGEASQRSYDKPYRWVWSAPGICVREDAVWTPQKP